ncbi:MAG: hypothetical protein VYD85_01280, partial [Pseudomonadota bacterium]|nr:hypothetical protein [Pseudomonadota bacterium]
AAGRPDISNPHNKMVDPFQFDHDHLPSGFSLSSRAVTLKCPHRTALHRANHPVCSFVGKRYIPIERFAEFGEDRLMELWTHA